MKLMQFFLSFKGRCSRKGYWMQAAIVMAIYMVFGLLAPDSEDLSHQDTVIAIFLLVILVLTLSQAAVSVRRFHDIGWSGWYVLLYLIPVVNIFPFVMNGFVRGEWGPNKYGDRPDKSE